METIPVSPCGMDINGFNKGLNSLSPNTHLWSPEMRFLPRLHKSSTIKWRCLRRRYNSQDKWSVWKHGKWAAWAVWYHLRVQARITLALTGACLEHITVSRSA